MGLRALKENAEFNPSPYDDPLAEYDEAEWGWLTLPEEMALMILELATQHSSLTVCQFVCRQWRRILMPKTARIFDKSRLFSVGEVVSEGNVGLLQWARDNGCRLKSDICESAAEAGQVELLKWLREKGYHWRYTCWKAAGKGHLEALRWSISKGAPWDRITVACAAARGGHIEVLAWLRETGCPWKVQICSEAAAGGHIEVVKWLKANGCPWDQRTCESAAKNGQLETLKWLRQNGCPWTIETTTANATYGGHTETLNWLLETQWLCFRGAESRVK